MNLKLSINFSSKLHNIIKAVIAKAVMSVHYLYINIPNITYEYLSLNSQ